MRQIVNGIYLPMRDTHFAAQIRSNPIINGKGTYQFEKFRESLVKCTNFRTAIDVGAHVGLWSRMLSTYFKEVAAIEPMPDHLECLMLNVDGLDNVKIYPFAVSRFSGMLEMKYVEDVATAGVASSTDGDIEIPCRSLDSFEFENVDFIKIDAEGYEDNIVQSGKTLIQRDKPVIIVEQKKKTVKYDGRRGAAVDTLISYGMKVAWENHGDVCMTWE